MTGEFESPSSRPARLEFPLIAAVLLSLVSLLSGSAAAQPSPTPVEGIQSHAPPTGRVYRPVRTSKPPRIDGHLDDEVWQQAPRDDRFLSRLSKPYSAPSLDPTVMQIAYDAQNVYVAFSCGYSGPGPRDNTPLANERSVALLESVSILFDPQHDHSNWRRFVVTRRGDRADVEMTNNAAVWNWEWRGLWNSAVRSSDDSWTVEFAIPWGTLGLPAQQEEFTIGLNAYRQIPLTPESVMWSLAPPGQAPNLPPTHFGHLEGLREVSPDQRLFLAPYIAGLFRPSAAPASRLRDLLGTGERATLYAGIYGRARPVGPLQVELTINPDFSQVNPDQAEANLDRFELFFPEVREFFLEDRGRFEFGLERYQLFYSRRVGLRRGASGFEEVPLLYGAKALVRGRGTEIGLLNVATAPHDDSPSDNIGVLRVNQILKGNTRVGGILLQRAQPGSFHAYRAYGLDGSVSLADEHLVLSGFLARSNTEGAPSGNAGAAVLSWLSQPFRINATYLQVGSGFDPQLGFFEQRGIRRHELTAGYTPEIHSDLIRSVTLSAGVDRTTDREDVMRVDRRTVLMRGVLLNFATLEAAFVSSVDRVVQDFSVGGGRIPTATGQYGTLYTRLTAASPTGRLFDFNLSYTDGTYFDGHQRILVARGNLNYLLFNTALVYSLLQVRAGGVRVVGHRISARLVASYTPHLRSVLSVETNTFDPTATALLVTSWNFGSLSNLSFALSQSGPNVHTWATVPRLQAILKFTYGFTPF